MAPLGARAADLVVWWEEGQAAEEDEAVREVIAAFEQDSGKQVELVLGPQEELVADLVAALEAGRRTPDFVFTVAETQPYEQWAYEGRLVDLTDAVGHFSDLFDPMRSSASPCWTGRPAGVASTCCRWGSGPTTSTSGRACSSAPASRLADIPKEWDAFWSFWCDQVQPAIRRRWAATTSGAPAFPCRPPRSTRANGIWQFIHAYEADYVTRDGRLVIDDPEVRRRLIQAVDSYTQIYRKGCTPPDP